MFVVSRVKVHCPCSIDVLANDTSTGWTTHITGFSLKAMWLYVWDMTPSWHALQGGGFSDPPSTYVQPAVAANPMAQGMNGSEGKCIIGSRWHALCSDAQSSNCTCTKMLMDGACKLALQW